MEREVRSSSNRDAIRLSGDFHLLLAEMGQNDVLAEFLKELVLRSSLIIGLYSSPAASVCESDGHDQIIAAIAAGDEAAAVEVIDAHLRHLEAGLDFAEEQEVQDLRAILAGGLKPSRRARSLRVSG
jgi:DNA-binding GntR family transcriptional regulator